MTKKEYVEAIISYSFTRASEENQEFGGYVAICVAQDLIYKAMNEYFPDLAVGSLLDKQMHDRKNASEKVYNAMINSGALKLSKTGKAVKPTFRFEGDYQKLDEIRVEYLLTEGN